MTSQLVQDFQCLKSENQQLRSENQRLRAANQAAKKREERYRKKLEIIKKGFADRDRQDRERLERLMLKVHRNEVESESKISKQIAFPQEIMDQFIDHLYGDRRALEKCALVCRAWVSSSRYHLFGVINISPLPHHPPFAGLIGHLDHPLCTFASSVRELYILAFTGFIFSKSFGVDQGWLDPLIPQLAKLVSVKFLSDYRISSRSTISCWQALLKSASFTTQITHLSLSSPSFESFEQCMETIHSFPSLVRLECHLESQPDNEWPGTVSLPAFRGSTPPPLHVLVITSHYSTVQLPWSRLMWQWLHRSQTRLSTIRLGVVSISADDVSAAKLYPFAQYLQFLGPSLEVLEIDFDDAPSISLFIDNVDLTLNTRLRVLELREPPHAPL